MNKKYRFKAYDNFLKREVESRLILNIHFDRRTQEPNLLVYMDKYKNPTREITCFDKIYCNDFVLMEEEEWKKLNQ